MSEPHIVAVVENKMLRIIGNQHSGWEHQSSYHSGGSKENIREICFRFEMQYDGYGYLLCYASKDSSLYGDTWHETQKEAEFAALNEFGIQMELELELPPFNGQFDIL